MESSFQWLNDLFRWIGRLFPRWRVVTEAQAGVAFKRGRARLVEPGILWWWPAWTEIHVQEVVRQTLRLPPQSLMTREHQDIAVSGIVVYEIIDPLTAFVKVHDLDDAIQDMAAASIKRVLRNLSLAEMYSQSDELDAELCSMGQELLRDWGVEIHNIFLADLSHAMVIRHMGSGERATVLGSQVEEEPGTAQASE
ncbi:MAG: SPFH domain-containing protein [Planctomycetota bacterium]|jgi:regulator of protease activity HflC (stomatin/prohibitin superfamily)